jgi:hypothetical protein
MGSGGDDGPERRSGGIAGGLQDSDRNGRRDDTRSVVIRITEGCNRTAYPRRDGKPDRPAHSDQGS